MIGHPPNEFVPPPSVVLPEATPPIIGPWSIVGQNATNDTVTLTNGYVEIHHEAGTSYLTPPDMTVTLANGDNYIYLTVNPVASNCTLQVSYTAKPASTALLYKKLLWLVGYSTATTPHVITRKFQYHNSSVEFTGWRPPW